MKTSSVTYSGYVSEFFDVLGPSLAVTYGGGGLSEWDNYGIEIGVGVGIGRNANVAYSYGFKISSGFLSWGW